MKRALTAFAVGVAAALPVQAQTATAAAGPPDRMAVFDVSDAALRSAIRRIDSGSASWRSALDSVARTGGRIVVTTVQELGDLPEKFGRDELAGVVPLAGADSVVGTVFVVINRELLDRMYRLAGGEPYDRNADLMRILAHEIYGHAVPYLIAGHLSGACPDPVDGAADPLGCSIQRENVVRAELRLGVRRSYDLSGLALSRYLAMSR